MKELLMIAVAIRGRVTDEDWNAQRKGHYRSLELEEESLMIAGAVRERITYDRRNVSRRITDDH